MKKVFTVVFILTIALFFTKCTPYYASSEPTYIQTVRPAKPSDHHVWVKDRWVYSRRLNMYVHKEGHYVRRRHKTYHEGHWKRTNKGYRWVKGHW